MRATETQSNNPKIAIIHRADSRGKANHGWLQSAHTFSFASYHNPSRMGFGALRVINDDTIAAGAGFGTHPHEDMEIITVPLAGAILHKDSTGHEGTIEPGEVQLMSAGKGIRHSEYNASPTKPLSLLQIWVLPESEGGAPGYQQRRFSEEGKKDRFQWVVSRDGVDGSLRILQKAAFARASITAGKTLPYQLRHPGNGVYFFLIAGELEILSEKISARDGLATIEGDRVPVKALKDSELLVMEVPLLD